MVAMRDSSGMALAVGRFAGWEPLGFEAGMRTGIGSWRMRRRRRRMRLDSFKLALK